MQAVNANGVPVMISNQPGRFLQDRRLPFNNMNNGVAKGLMVLGSLQIVFGILAMCFNAVGLSKYHNASYDVSSAAFIGHGFWMGIVFIITGPFGIVGGIRKIRWSLVTFNILSIASASFAGLMLIISATAAGRGFESDRRSNNKNNNINKSYSRDIQDTSGSEMQGTLAIIETMMAVVAVLEGISALCSSIICCAVGACCHDCCSDGQGCCPSDSNSTMVMVTGQELRSPPQQFAMFDMANRSEMAMPSNQQQSYYSTYTQLDYQYETLIVNPSSNGGYQPVKCRATDLLRSH